MIRGTILISVSELCFDIILVCGYGLQDTTHKMNNALRFPIIVHYASVT